MFFLRPAFDRYYASLFVLFYFVHGSSLYAPGSVLLWHLFFSFVIGALQVRHDNCESSVIRAIRAILAVGAQIFSHALKIEMRIYRLNLPDLSPVSFYRAMHFSAKRGIAIACRLSVRLSVCNVGGL